MHDVPAPEMLLEVDLWGKTQRGRGNAKQFRSWSNTCTDGQLPLPQARGNYFKVYDVCIQTNDRPPRQAPDACQQTTNCPDRNMENSVVQLCRALACVRWLVVRCGWAVASALLGRLPQPQGRSSGPVGRLPQPLSRASGLVGRLSGHVGWFAGILHLAV